MTARPFGPVAGNRRAAPRGRVIVSVCILAATSCLPFRKGDPEVAPRRSAARDSLLAADLRRTDTVVARGLAAAMSTILAPDVAYLHPGAPPVFGSSHALVLLSPATNAARPISGWQPLGGGISRDGLAGYTYGLTVRPGAAERYVAYWTRPRSGEWRIAAYAEVGPAERVVTGSVTGSEVPVLRLPERAAAAARSLVIADSNFAEYSTRFGTGAGFADAVADDGVMFAGTELLVGPRAIREYFDSRRGTSLTWRPIYGSGAASGDLGFTVGESVSTSRGPSGAAVQRFAKYLTIWRREPNGRWKFVVDGGNSRPSPVGN